MTFIQTITQWYGFVFKIISDFFGMIFQYDWLAFAFFSVFVLGVWEMVGAMFPSLPTILKVVRMYQSDQRRLVRDAERQADRAYRLQQRRIASNRDRYAQGLLNSKPYLNDNFVTIEGKRYYRKGLVQHGKRRRGSDRDFSSDLQIIDNQ